MSSNHNIHKVVTCEYCDFCLGWGKASVPQLF